MIFYYLFFLYIVKITANSYKEYKLLTRIVSLVLDYQGNEINICIVDNFARVGVNCSNCDCSTVICSTLLAGNQLLDTFFVNCSNPVNPG